MTYLFEDAIESKSHFGIVFFALLVLSVLLYVASWIAKKKDAKYSLIFFCSSIGVGALGYVFILLWSTGFSGESSQYMTSSILLFNTAYLLLISGLRYRGVDKIGTTLIILFLVTTAAACGLAFYYGRAHLENETEIIQSSKAFLNLL